MTKFYDVRMAFIALNNRGKGIALHLQSLFYQSTIYLFSRQINSKANDCRNFSSLKTLIATIFSRYDAICFISSTGIALRTCAPYLVDKLHDPAILVCDENSNFVISLLSGHLGRANEITTVVAKHLQATPVITTATDGKNLFTPDRFAGKFHLQATPTKLLKKINSAINDNQNITYYIDEALPDAKYYHRRLPFARSWNRACSSHLAVLVTEKTFLETNYLQLLPPRLSIGIGCRRNTSVLTIARAICRACRYIHVSPRAIVHLSSTVAKKNEPGLLQFANLAQIELNFFDNMALQKQIIRHKLQTSPFVEKTIGVGNVCEAAALCFGTKLLLPKIKFQKVTVAIVWENFLSSV